MPKVAKLVHLSDLHIGRTRQEMDRTLLLFKWIAAHHPGVPVLVTGDLTQSGTAGHCDDARALLEGLAASNPVLTVPGNHDYGFHGMYFQQRAWRNYYTTLAKPLGWPTAASRSWLSLGNDSGLGVLQHGEVAYFGLDSCDPDDLEICAIGRVKRGLTSLLRAELGKTVYSDKTRVVMLHHHPIKWRPFLELRGARRLMRALEGRCDVLLFGHHHDCGVWWDEKGISLIVGSHKSPNRLFGVSLGVGLIEIRDPGTPHAEIEYQMEAVGVKLVK